MEWTINLENTTGSILTIPDLGWNLQVGVNPDVLKEFDFGRLAGSKGLEDAVTAGQVVVNDGTSNLSPAEGNAFLKRAHKKYVDDQLAAATATSSTSINNLATEVDNTQTGAGLDVNGDYATRTTSNYLNTSTSLYEDGTLLDAQVKVNEVATTNLGTELDNTQTGAGLDPAGAFITRTDSNYLDTSISLYNDSTLLDAQVKINETGIVNVQTELDDTQTGAGLDASGNYITRTGTNYLNTSTSLYEDGTLLDAQVAANEAAITALGTGSLTALQTEVDDTQAGAGLNVDGAYIVDATTNYLSSATSLANADKLLDTELVNIAADVAQNKIDIGTNTGAISTNITAITTEETTRIAEDTKLQTEIDAIELAAGLNTDGTWDTHSGTNYIDTATDSKNARELLDTQIKTNETDIAALSSASTTGLDTKVDKTGDIMTGNLDMGSNEVYTTSSPSSGNALANKTYVDMKVQGISPKAAADVATIIPLPSSTYNNGVGGVGATITANSPYSTLQAIDTGHTSIIGTTILVNGEGDRVRNGVYVVQDLGSDTTPWVLERRDDLDGSPAMELQAGTQVPIKSGNTWSGYVFYLAGTQGQVFIPGTDDIDFDYTPGSTATANVTNEVDAIELATGLNSDGSWNPHTGTNYLDVTTNAKEAREVIDTQVAANTSQITTNTADIGTHSTAITTNITTLNDHQTQLDTMKVEDGILYGWDNTKSKWIGSIEGHEFGFTGMAKDQWLETMDGITSYLVGSRISRDSCATALTLQLASAANADITVELYKSNTTTPFTSHTVTAGSTGGEKIDIDEDLVAGDDLKVRAYSTDFFSQPIVRITTAYRGLP